MFIEDTLVATENNDIVTTGNNVLVASDADVFPRQLNSTQCVPYYWDLAIVVKNNIERSRGWVGVIEVGTYYPV